MEQLLQAQEDMKHSLNSMVSTALPGSVGTGQQQVKQMDSGTLASDAVAGAQISNSSGQPVHPLLLKRFE
uniref:Uncharacterized protein n=1 Tax=Ditylenchus dipsaci TaxID=166011 RepID=A0A915DM10_9BILA